ncbi:hypothetical protein IFM89_005678 [Coptis chinensis]|uniref:Lipid desaturase domain-containing protein n=1 Tax=Coptis chinensis TaxID=261450 RepID=A0A835GZ31_9MAGN|nr:hypothetical protein IFM89_005678 [Coptis chinensis]
MKNGFPCLGSWSQLPRVVVALQSVGVLISPGKHALHHRPPFGNNYCMKNRRQDLADRRVPAHGPAIDRPVDSLEVGSLSPGRFLPPVVVVGDRPPVVGGPVVVR